MTHPKPEMVAIPHTGTKPAWLEDDTLVRCGSGPMHGAYDLEAGRTNWKYGHGLFLPADHWAAPVILANLTPWNPTLQGDGPPKDYAGGKVMERSGEIRVYERKNDEPYRWSWSTGAATNIIGYEATPAQHPKPAQDVEQGDAVAKLRLWFFRECNEGTRRHLYSIFGFPVDEIRNHGIEGVVFKRILARLATQSPAAELERKLAIAEAALEPFSAFAEHAVDAEGWSSSTGRERILDWFGPSEFRAAREALAQIRNGGGG